MDDLRVLSIAALVASSIAILLNICRLIKAKRAHDPHQFHRSIRLLTVSLILFIIAFGGSR
jgi:hypothetical protein